MGAFELIEKKEYDAFCALYLERSHLQKEQSEYADLMPGNYTKALIGARQYETLVSFCKKMIAEIGENSPKIDRSSSLFFIALSIGYFELGKYQEAIQALQDGSRAAYQDRPRTQAPGILYYEATMLNDKKAKQESKKLLNARLRNKNTLSPEFATAKFLLGKCSEEEMLAQIEIHPPILKERAKVQALFYMAVKAFESGDFDGYAKNLKDACELYNSVPTVTLEFEYHLSEICRSRINS
ncbi:hypothetical protein [uncultured Dysosmobacter sp.]|uniref:hypothetical protein n=1 Tax=uncultured Dysosmobacter sp. TaxID=2591384 RepID=UPI00262C483D|nr:hypothetical protein [uncultured Dysosmobacter sp.]